jgi:hypothetical protein
LKIHFFMKAAKENHPDLHPDDKKANQKFQEVSKAYQVTMYLQYNRTRVKYLTCNWVQTLSDESKRRIYDSYGAADTYERTQQRAGHSQQHTRGQGAEESQQYEDMFRGVQADIDVIFEGRYIFSETDLLYCFCLYIIIFVFFIRCSMEYVFWWPERRSDACIRWCLQRRLWAVENIRQRK